MTFGGELMIVALLLLSVSIWGDSKIQRVLALFCFLFLWAALALGLTRGIFLIGVPLGAAYLLLSWRMWTVAAIPAIILVSALLMPFQVRERVLSVLHPHGNDDSNNRRIILVRTGLNMIRAHPFLGVGPEQVGKQFHSYVPADVPRPLPKGWYGHLHNVYLQYAAERGLPALVLLLWILARILRDLSAEARAGTKSAAAWLIQGSVAVTLAVMGEGVFEHNLGDSEVLTMFLVTISCAYVIKWQQIGPLVTPLRAAVSRPLRERTALARPRAG
jgi:O-antigen ligase